MLCMCAFGSAASSQIALSSGGGFAVLPQCMSAGEMLSGRKQGMRRGMLRKPSISRKSEVYQPSKNLLQKRKAVNLGSSFSFFKIKNEILWSLNKAFVSSMLKILSDHTVLNLLSDPLLTGMHHENKQN